MSNLKQAIKQNYLKCAKDPSHFINESIEKNISTKCLKETQSKMMRIIMPFMPHVASECLQQLEGENFYEKSEWPKVDNSLIEEDDITIVIQINGKKRGLLSTKKDVEEKEAIAKAKNIENIKKNLMNKKIIKNIFVKNKVINFIVA